MKRQIEIPVHNNSNVVSRSLKENHPDNQNMYESSQEFQDLLREVKIRFDTNPNFYLKEDYLKLIELIRKKGGAGGNIEVEILGDGNVVTDIVSNDNILNVTKGQARYPRVRWARRGFIDLTNCKDIDYIIVPCTTKQLCLYVTNDYLKKLRHIETYESIYGLELESDGGNPIIPADFFKVVSQYFDNVIEVCTHTYRLPRVLGTFKDLSKLPCTTDTKYFINIKEFAVTKNPKHLSYNPLKILFNRKDVHHGFIQFPYFKLKGPKHEPKSIEENTSFLDTRFIFTPYMVFANPFNSTLGGVIPVKDGKLLIEKATRLKNKTLELVSTGLLIRFDEYGICDTQLNPETFIYTTRKKAKLGKSGGRYFERKVIIHNPIYSPRRSSISVRRNIRMATGMRKRMKGGVVYGWRTTKWIELVPCIVYKHLYKRNLKDYLISQKGKGQNNRFITLDAFDRTSPSTRGGYFEFSTNNPAILTTHLPVLKYFKAPYDRMNTYTINKYSPLVKVLVMWHKGYDKNKEHFEWEWMVLNQSKYSV